MAQKNVIAKWLESHVVQLLSWADIAIKHDDIDFDKTVVSHLKQKCGWIILLQGLLDKWGTRDKDSTRSRTIINKGSICLINIPDALRSQIALACEDFEVELRASKQPSRSTDSGSKSKKHGRNNSQANTQKPAPEVQGEKTSGSTLPRTPMKLRKRDASSIPEESQYITKRRKLTRDATFSPEPQGKETHDPILPKAHTKRKIRDPDFDTEVSQSATKKRKVNPDSTYSPDPLSCTHHQSFHIIEDSQDENTQTASENGQTTPRVQSPTSVRKGRLSQRCDYCRRRKVACNGARPACSNCTKKGLQSSCSYEDAPALSESREKRLSFSEPAHHVEDDTTDEKTRCICKNAQTYTDWVQCKNCSVWQHCICVGVGITEAKNIEFSCKECSTKAPYEEHIEKEHIEKEPLSKSSEICDKPGYGSQTDSVLLALAKEDVSRLREIVEESNLEVVELKESLQVTSMDARRLRSNLAQLGKNSPEYVLDKKDQEIKALRKELETRRFLSRFTQLGDTSDETFKYDSVQNLVDVFGTIDQLPFDEVPVIVPPGLDHYQELEKIILDTFGQDETLRQTAEDLGASLSSMKTHVVFRALTASFLKLWVFESDFPQLEGSSSDYVKSIRKKMTAADGPKAMRNLDLAARYDVISSEKFKHQYIYPEAERLAIKYSEIMEPLFAKNPGSEIFKNWDGFSTWNDDKETWQDRQSRLIGMFRVALKSKADSTLNFRDYELVAFVPGTPYDPKSMFNEDALYRKPGGNNSDWVVEFCIQPAIYVHEKERTDDFISSQSFVRKTVRSGIGLTPSVKAEVLLRPKNGGS
ncbi:putative transcription factor cys6 protein [Botrytis fragariae]|uniref:Putative transcription factor cys6 protein n=1 Tax=Botrytis fragariae TaxID=1964551 RepID=A0A8H6EKX6_9HELO|nr:putative transcription factor cys6 protein [Botrytis fragariae]KAF5875670.1 putative transcription factor cys6 protein [Botrytis fragariae]